MAGAFLFVGGGCAAILAYVHHTHARRYPAARQKPHSDQDEGAPPLLGREADYNGSDGSGAEFKSAAASSASKISKIMLRWNVTCAMACWATLSALYLNLVLNMFLNFDDSTRTHCTALGVYNFLPSISACIGGFTRPIWSLCVVVYIWQRVLAGFVLHAHHHAALSLGGRRRGHRKTEEKQWLVRIVAARLWAHTGEQLFLVLLSVVSSSDNLFLHELGFAGFSSCSIANMALTCYVCSSMVVAARHSRGSGNSGGGHIGSGVVSSSSISSGGGGGPALAAARAALRTRTVLSLAALASLLSAVYFFFAHQRACVDYRYTWFALGEWLFVFFNIIFHFEGEMRELSHVDFAWTFGRKVHNHPTLS